MNLDHSYHNKFAYPLKYVVSFNLEGLIIRHQKTKESHSSVVRLQVSRRTVRSPERAMVIVTSLQQGRREGEGGQLSCTLESGGITHSGF